FAVTVPPHAVTREIVDDRVLVLGGASGMVAGLGAERAAFDDGRFLAGDGVFVQRGFGQIPADLGEPLETEFVGAIGAVPQPQFLHAYSSQPAGRLNPMRVRRSCSKP